MWIWLWGVDIIGPWFGAIFRGLEKADRLLDWCFSWPGRTSYVHAWDDSIQILTPSFFDNISTHVSLISYNWLCCRGTFSCIEWTIYKRHSQKRHWSRYWTILDKFAAHSTNNFLRKDMELFPRFCCWTLIWLSRHWVWLCWGILAP